MLVITHIVDRNYHCSRCGLRMGELHLSPTDFNKVQIGDRIGVISGLTSSKDSAYVISKPEHDSNALCEPRKSVT